MGHKEPFQLRQMIGQVPSMSAQHDRQQTLFLKFGKMSIIQNSLKTVDDERHKNGMKLSGLHIKE